MIISSLSIPFYPPAPSYIPTSVAAKRVPGLGYQVYLQDSKSTNEIESNVSHESSYALISSRILIPRIASYFLGYYLSVRYTSKALGRSRSTGKTPSWRNEASRWAKCALSFSEFSSPVHHDTVCSLYDGFNTGNGFLRESVQRFYDRTAYVL